MSGVDCSMNYEIYDCQNGAIDECYTDAQKIQEMKDALEAEVADDKRQCQSSNYWKSYEDNMFNN